MVIFPFTIVWLILHVMDGLLPRYILWFVNYELGFRIYNVVSSERFND